MAKNNFNIYEQLQPTNKNIIVTFTPNKNTTQYEYNIIKDKKVIKNETINDFSPVDISLEETGEYEIKVITYNELGEKQAYDSGIYIIDKEKPIIKTNITKFEILIGDNINIMNNISAFDNQDGDLLHKVTTNIDQLDLTTPGVKTLTYSVFDSAGNFSSLSIPINVYNNFNNSIMALQFIVVSFIIVLVLIVDRYRKGIKLEKRIAKYTINPIKDDSLSLGDQLFWRYKKIIDALSAMLEKSVIIKKISKRYEKYINIINNHYYKSIDFISEKLLISMFFILMAFLSKLMRYELITYYDALIPIIFGFFTPDIIYLYKYKRYRNKLENDFLQAITVMNNAFKSGRSITQAIDLVVEELDGPIANEFKKMSMELNFGLSIDVVFKRFAERVQLEEATYVTVSLSILSQTGGNIIKVFTSIEKSLFNKKKLKLEFNSLTGSSKIIVSLLTCLPIFFVFVITIINPNYFVPLYTTELGKVILFIIGLIYILYIYIIQKFLRIRL